MSTGISEPLFKALGMMDNCEETVVVFGYDAIEQLAAYVVQNDCKTVMLVMGGRSAELSGAFKAFHLTYAFGKLDLNMPRFEHVPPEPDTDSVRAIEKAFRLEKPDAVIAIGGGSVIDAAKAAYLSWQTGLDVTALFGKNIASAQFPEKKFKRIFAVPTTAGTGSEVTNYSNIIDPGSGLKKIIADSAIIPEFAAVNPIFTISMPEKLTRDTGFDALVHAIEGLLNFKAGEEHPETKKWALQAIRTIVAALPQVLKNPENEELRAELAAASTLAGMTIRAAPTSMPHLLSFSFCGKSSHGAAVSALLPHFWRFYLKEEKVRELTMTLSDVFPGKNPEQVVDSYEKFILACGGTVSPGTLAGEDSSMIDKLAADAVLNPVKLESAPRKIAVQDCKNILHEVLDKVWTK